MAIVLAGEVLSLWDALAAAVQRTCRMDRMRPRNRPFDLIHIAVERQEGGHLRTHGRSAPRSGDAVCVAPQIHSHMVQQIFVELSGRDQIESFERAWKLHLS